MIKPFKPTKMQVKPKKTSWIVKKSSEELSKVPKFDVVMKEFESGKLLTPAGGLVKDKKQALAIAFSEARRHKP